MTQSIVPMPVTAGPTADLVRVSKKKSRIVPTSTRLYPLLTSPQLHELITEHTRQHPVVLDTTFPFSWPRCALFFVSYFLLLSDIMRAGVGIHAFDPSYVRLEPDAFVHFGPYAYWVQTLRSNHTNTLQERRWLYQHDSTSIALRAYVDLLNVTAFPPCLLYRGPCLNDTIGFQTMFTMLNALVDTVASRSSSRHAQAVDPVSISTRVRHLWMDRFHHYVLPRFFYGPLFRTNRALYYTPQALDHHSQRGFCASKRFRPHSCQDLWINYRHTPLLLNQTTRQTNGSVFDDLQQRVQAFRTQYAGHKVDLLLIDSSDEQTKGGVCFQGRRMFDIVSILRARKCDSNGSCNTVVLEDYRFEAAMETSNVVDWYHFIALMRIVGQTYMWLRLLLLFFGCYFARIDDTSFTKLPFLSRLYKTWLTMLMIPSQVVIYSSFFPIVCYMLALLIDAPIHAEVIAERYRTLFGFVEFDLSEFIRLSSVLMRNVWLFAAVLHLLVLLRTYRLWLLTDGIVGICELCISLTSALTTIAHYRSVDFRDSRVLEVVQVADSNTIAAAKLHRYYDGGNIFRSLSYGLILDGKMLFLSLGFVAFAAWLLGLVLRGGAKMLTRTVIWTRTYVSHAAYELWPANALVVGWDGNFLVHDSHRLRMIHAENRSIASASKPMLRQIAMIHQQGKQSTRLKLALLDKRRQEDQALLFLMNLCMMTDPITLWQLRLGRGKPIAILRSRVNHELLMLPHTITAERISDLELHEMELLQIVRSSELSWMQLLNCG